MKWGGGTLFAFLSDGVTTQGGEEEEWLTIKRKLDG